MFFYINVFRICYSIYFILGLFVLLNESVFGKGSRLNFFNEFLRLNVYLDYFLILRRRRVKNLGMKIKGKRWGIMFFIWLFYFK